jgi:quinol monooxygenase YgiN
MAQANFALLATLKAKPGRERELKEFLAGALPLARDEKATTTWFAIRIDETTFGIFDTFADESGREAHLQGRIASALMDRAPELLAEDPDIRKVDVLAAKM